MSEYTNEEYAVVKARALEALRIPQGIRLGAMYGTGGRVPSGGGLFDTEQKMKEWRKLVGAEELFWDDKRLRRLNKRITRHCPLTGRKL